jgi:acyl-CoA reductase-like NAD-dependent aldehyde dehydrogenase
VPIIIDKKVEETPKSEPVYTSGELSPAIKAGNIVIGKPVELEPVVKPKPKLTVVVNKGNISPAIKAGNIIIESAVEETPVKPAAAEIVYAKAPDVIPEKARTREKKVSQFMEHMTTV